MAEERATRIPFNGTMEHWFYWSQMFMSRAQYQGYHLILMGLEKPPADSATIDESTEAGKAEMKLRKLHRRAHYKLTMSMNLKTIGGKTAFRTVRNATSKDFPAGDAREAWLRLREEYESSTGSAQLELKRKFHGSMMQANQNPTTFITNLANIRERMEGLGINVTDADFRLQILNSLPREYENVQDMLKAANDKGTLTTTEIKVRLRERYVALNKWKGAKLISTGDEDDKKEEQAMAMVAGGILKCTNCGKTGYTAAQCWAPGGGKAGQGPSGKKKQFKGNCRHCGKYGHKASDCWLNPKSPNYKGGGTGNSGNQGNYGNTTNVEQPGGGGYESDVSFMAKSGSGGPGARHEVWVGDTGATCHMTGFDSGFVDWKESNEQVIFGNGDILKVVKIGTWKGTVMNPDGTTQKVTLRDTKLVPGIVNNLFAINRCVDKGWEYISKSDKSVLQRDNTSIVFAKVDQTNGGSLREVRMVPQATESANAANEVQGKPKAVKLKALHHRLGHAAMESVKATAKHFGWQTTGDLDKCVACATAKAKRKKLNRELQEKSKIPGERLFLDISSVKAQSIGGAKFWLLVQDDATDMCWSFLIKEKSDLSQSVMNLLLDLRLKHNTRVKYIRCDNAGENVALKKRCDNGGLGVTFEFTAVKTPEQNGRVERLFQTLYGRVRATLRGAGIGEKYRQKLWAECAATITKVYTVTVKREGEKPPYQQFYGVLPAYVHHLCRFGEVGVVTRFGQGEIKGKLADRGKIKVFVGYANNHPGDVYRMLMFDIRCYGIEPLGQPGHLV